MRTAIGLLAATVLLTLAPSAGAKKIDCGTIAVMRARLPVQITAGQVSCRTARRAMRRFLPVEGRGDQSFKLARRRWFCADAHGPELTRHHIVAHCVAGSVRVVLREPPPSPGSTRSNPIPFGQVARSGEWSIRVLATTPDATALVLAENQFNDPPAPGRQFYIAKVEATYVGSDSATFDASFRLRAVGNAAVEYTSFDDSCGVIPDAFPESRAFPGGVLQGAVCWAVPSSDAGSLVMYDDGEWLAEADPLFFSLVP